LISVLEALALGPADVHAHQHLGPVLGLGAAGAGVHGDDGVERVGLAGEHGLGFELFGELDERGDLAFEVGLGGFAFAGEFEVGLDVVGAAGEFGVVGEEGFEALALAHERLRRARRRPRRWGRRSFLRWRLVRGLRREESKILPQLAHFFADRGVGIRDRCAAGSSSGRKTWMLGLPRRR
jgi:hypothetical protein